MSTLWFDVTNLYYEDSDWSDLPGTDKSSELSNDYCEPMDPDFVCSAIRKEDMLDNKLGIGFEQKFKNDFNWLKPPEDWNKNGG